MRLDETTLDLYMAKNISNILKISLDKLVENEKEFVKMSNTEKLLCIKIKMLKWHNITIISIIFFNMLII